MVNLAPIHNAVKQVLDTQTYQSYSYPTLAQALNLKGVGQQIIRQNPEYEIGYHAIPIPGTNRVNVYARTGADGYQQSAGYGNVVIRNFYTDIFEFDGSPSDRTYVYQPTDYAVFEHCEYAINGNIWMFTREKDRATQTLNRIMVSISTDGLIGRTFSPAIPVVSGGTALTDALTFSPYIITDTSGNMWMYFSCESPTGLYRVQINSSLDGSFSNYARLTTAITMSECCVTTVDNTGKLACVYRVNSGTRNLMMITSSNNGATWSGTPINTGLGFSDGTKVQPRLMQSADPGRFIVSFMDRQTRSIDMVSTLNLKANCYANSYRTVIPLGSAQTNGNGDLCVIDQEKRLYFYVACGISSLNAPNTLNYWVFQDSTTPGPRPWQ